VKLIQGLYQQLNQLEAKYLDGFSGLLVSMSVICMVFLSLFYSLPQPLLTQPLPAPQYLKASILNLTLINGLIVVNGILLIPIGLWISGHSHHHIKRTS
jgi:hypothetical protein